MIALANIVALVMIYVGYVQRYSLLAAGGVLVLAVTMYLHGRSQVRREILPHLDQMVSDVERWLKDGVTDMPELDLRVRNLRRLVRIWNRD